MSARLGLRISVVLLLAAVAAPAAAQETAGAPNITIAALVDKVRTLYGAAVYEEALAAIPTAVDESVRTDLERYCALCLLALGREKEAVSTVERLVQDNPMFVPAAADTSPRMQAIFARARSKLIPDIAKRTYAEAKVAYESKDRDGAHAAFGRTIGLIDSLPEAERTVVSDLRLLASEFLAGGPTRRQPQPPVLDQSSEAGPGGRTGACRGSGADAPLGTRPTARRRGRSILAWCES